MKDVLFYTTKDEYWFLTNFARVPQTIDGITYPTNEHYYQSEKAIVPELKLWIANAPNPYAAMLAGRNLREKELNPDWDIIKFDVMLRGLRAKFFQNVEIQRLLLATGDAAIHENSPTDLVWGIKGQDMLGKLLMKVRAELNNGV